MANKLKRILFVVNDSWFFVSHRLIIASKALALGHEVHVLARMDDKSVEIEKAGCIYHKWDVSSRGTSVLSEFKAIKSLSNTVSRLQPDLVHLVTIKAVLYGGIVSRYHNINSAVYSISGLGSIFLSNGKAYKLLRILFKPIYKFSISHKNSTIIFQNHDDQKYFLNDLGVNVEQTVLIHGSGVDLKKFSASPIKFQPFSFLMGARLLKDKGVIEFCEAAEIVKTKHPKSKFVIAGDQSGKGNPSSISDEELQELKKLPVEFIGSVQDIENQLRSCTVAVLPSYREGLPKFLAEAAASGRPIITTDVPGCRSTVNNGKNGLLVKPRDAHSLAAAMITLIEDLPLSTRMGGASRILAEELFNQDVIVEQHIRLYNKLSS